MLAFFFKDNNAKYPPPPHHHSQNKVAVIPVFIFFSLQLAEGAHDYPAQFINYNLTEMCTYFFALLY